LVTITAAKTGIDVDQLSVAVGGEGNPAVFVHGFGANKWTWRYLSRGMQDTFTYYLIDLPGSGMSPAPKRFNYTIENFADVIAAFIVRKNPHNVTLIGKSLGGGVVLLTMLRHSDDLRTRIKRICIIDGINSFLSLSRFCAILFLARFWLKGFYPKSKPGLSWNIAISIQP
jgi:pimeloyl-ACP methyl ester carboxylesterase